MPKLELTSTLKMSVGAESTRVPVPTGPLKKIWMVLAEVDESGS